MSPAVRFLILSFLSLSLTAAQSPNGTISGIVHDPLDRPILDAEILIVNDLTNIQYETRTNDEGIYVVPNLPPGPYRIQVTKRGFKTLIKPGLILNVQNALSVSITLPLGAVSEVITVAAGAPLINTTDASVSTVVDRQFVANTPLNGRSFQSLIALTPGVVTQSPQAGAILGNSGEFSVNGQRTESNYYTVDGVSANTGVAPTNGKGPGASGSIATASALGTTQALVSVDALEEFRVQSSSYSAEYGRTPGGQFAFVTRSGTNDWHGTAFDYLRNDAFDANNWFNDYFRRPEPPLRQNDFGGTLSGPIEIPRIYKGKDRTFFFFSYEGLRLQQPQAASISYVPDAALRATTPAPLQQVLNAFPQANGPDLGNGLAEFIGTWANPSAIDSYSARVDHSFGEKLKVFLRWSDSPSSSVTRGNGTTSTPSVLTSLDYVSRTYTLGVTSLLSSRLGNEFRLNYTSNDSKQSNHIDSFGGGTALDLAQLAEISPLPNAYQIAVGIAIGGVSPRVSQNSISADQRQWNFVDSVNLQLGKHQVRAGFDYRRLTPTLPFQSPADTYFFFSASAVAANSVTLGQATTNANAYPLYQNFSTYVQDEWHVVARLNVSLGLRWDVNPAPSVTKGFSPYPVNAIADLSSMSLGRSGSSLWKTTWGNVAPRLGAAYLLRTTPGRETVLRGGIGLFFDTAQQLGSEAFGGPGTSAINSYGSDFGVPASFPVPPSQAEPKLVNPPVPPYVFAYAFPRNLKLPYTIQWNATVEQALGQSQALRISYVGSHAARLLEVRQINVAPFNPDFTGLQIFQNGLTADYDALQIQYQRRISRGLTALASYTFSHSIDYGSQNFYFPYERGDSDFDVRHNFTGAASYDIPAVGTKKWAGAMLRYWGLDGRFTARSGFPVTLTGNTVIDPGTGQTYYAGLDLIPGQPIYLYGQQYPGGRAINRSAFAEPAGCAATSCVGLPVGTAPRNLVRGFGAGQVDLAIRREFPLYERLRLQFRAEAFNVFNHPNFGLVDPRYSDPTFGQATATLNSSLGVMSPLYQTGGPRSMQLSLKLIF